MTADDLSPRDVTDEPPRTGTMLWRALRKRCPRCGGGKLYRTWFRQKERCPSCGMAFEREEGFFVGAYLINFAIIEIALFVVMMIVIVALAQDPEASLKLPIIGGVTLAIVLPLVTYPWSRTIWTAIVLAANPLELEEIVSARDHLEEQRQTGEAADT